MANQSFTRPSWSNTSPKVHNTRSESKKKTLGVCEDKASAAPSMDAITTKTPASIPTLQLTTPEGLVITGDEIPPGRPSVCPSNKWLTSQMEGEGLKPGLWLLVIYERRRQMKAARRAERKMKRLKKHVAREAARGRKKTKKT